MKRYFGLAALAAFLACGEARASSYTAIYSFGDSLSDVGNIYNITGHSIPIPPYSNGRFSNGANWLDDLSASLGLGPMVPIIALGGGVNPGGNDYAFGGAQTGITNVNPGLPPGTPLPTDLVSQVADFSAASPGGALFTLDIGANDIGNALTAAATDPTFDKNTFLTEAVGNTVGAIDALYADGMRNLLYFEVPDLSVVPAFKAAGPAGGELAKEFNEGVLAGIAPLRSGRADGLRRTGFQCHRRARERPREVRLHERDSALLFRGHIDSRNGMLGSGRVSVLGYGAPDGRRLRPHRGARGRRAEWPARSDYGARAVHLGDDADRLRRTWRSRVANSPRGGRGVLSKLPGRPGPPQLSGLHLPPIR